MLVNLHGISKGLAIKDGGYALETGQFVILWMVAKSCTTW